MDAKEREELEKAGCTIVEGCCVVEDNAGKPLTGLSEDGKVIEASETDCDGKPVMQITQLPPSFRGKVYTGTPTEIKNKRLSGTPDIVKTEIEVKK